MMHNKKYNYRKIGFYIFYFIFFVGSSSSFALGAADQGSTQPDFLEQSFQQSKDTNTVVNIGDTKDAVGQKLVDGGGGSFFGGQDSLFVSIIKWLLRIMAMIGVSMGIFVGITYILAQGDDGKEKKARDNLIKIAVGIVLALSALVIVNLVQSITRSSINL